MTSQRMSSEEDGEDNLQTVFVVRKWKWESKTFPDIKMAHDKKADRQLSERAKRMHLHRIEGPPSAAQCPRLEEKDRWVVQNEDIA